MIYEKQRLGVYSGLEFRGKKIVDNLVASSFCVVETIKPAKASAGVLVHIADIVIYFNDIFTYLQLFRQHLHFICEAWPQKVASCIWTDT